MAVFVILSLAVLAMTVGAVVVALLQVAKATRRTRDTLKGAQERLHPLTEELQSELAVTSAEAEALGQRVEAFRAARRGRPRAGRNGGTG